MRFPLSLLWKGTQKILNTKGNWGHKFLQLHKEREEIIQKKKMRENFILFLIVSTKSRVLLSEMRGSVELSANFFYSSYTFRCN